MQWLRIGGHRELVSSLHHQTHCHRHHHHCYQNNRESQFWDHWLIMSVENVKDFEDVIMIMIISEKWRWFCFCVLSAEWGSWGYFESNWTDKYKIQQIKRQIQNTTNKKFKIFRFGLSGFLWLWDLKKWKQVLGRVPFLFLNPLPKEKFVRWSSLIRKSSQKISILPFICIFHEFINFKQGL